MTSTLPAAGGPAPVSPCPSSRPPSPSPASPYCCPPLHDWASPPPCQAPDSAKMCPNGASVRAAEQSKQCDESGGQQQLASKLAELTCEAACIPAGVQRAPGCNPDADGADASDACAAAAAAKSTCRLAAVNNFRLNPDEPVRGMQELVHDLVAEISSGRKDLERLYNLMMSYDYSGNEWKRFEFWDDKKKYTRNLIASVPGVLCLMLLCWNPEKGSPIHNHSGSECFMRVLKGAIVEQQFVVKGGEGDAAASQNWNKITCSNIPASDLVMTHRNIYKEGGCTFINDSLGVHAVENPYKETAITLHAYIPGYDTCKSWQADASQEDESKGVKIQQCHISYDSEQGERTHA